MDFKTIIYDTRDGVAKITINRAERMNGYNETMVKDMCAAVDLARQDDGIPRPLTASDAADTMPAPPPVLRQAAFPQ